MHEPLPALRGRAASALFPIEARSLNLDIGGTRVLHDIDLALEPGPLTVIMGPNGAGKSLLLKLLHGLIAPTSGAVVWAGRSADRAVRRAQAMVFQHPVILRRSAMANIRHALRARGIAGAALAAAVDEALAAARLEDKAHVAGRALSGGERQRLAVARALALHPLVLFLDEPTASLDPASAAIVEALIRRANARGCKIIHVTHDRDQARRLADEIVFMHRGRIVEHLDARSFFARPAAPEARSYLAGELVI